MTIDNKVPPVLALKDADSERPIPTAWRPVINEIVRRFVGHDYQLIAGVTGVYPITPKAAEQIGKYIQDYGAELIELSEDTWDLSVCIWMGDRWDVLVDLWTRSEGRSDLALSLQVLEHGDSFEFKVYMVYVP